MQKRKETVLQPVPDYVAHSNPDPMQSGTISHVIDVKDAIAHVHVRGEGHCY